MPRPAYTYDVETFNADIARGPCAWPGGYPLFYLCSDGDTLCPKCAEENADNIREAIRDNDVHGSWRVVGCDANWEDPRMYCAHCNERIESAYAEEAVDCPPWRIDYTSNGDNGHVASVTCKSESQATTVRQAIQSVCGSSIEQDGAFLYVIGDDPPAMAEELESHGYTTEEV